MATLEPLVRGAGDRDRIENLQSALSRAVARGEGAEGVLAVLSAQLGARVEHVEETGPAADGALTHPVVTAAEPLGALRVCDVVEADLETIELLAVAADFVGVEIVKARAAQEATWAFDGELLRELIDAGRAPSARLRERAGRAAVDLAEPWTHMALDAGTAAPALLAAARRAGPGGARSLACRSGDQVLVAAAVAGAGRDGVDGELARLARVASGVGTQLWAGVSSATTDFAAGHRQAVAALALARQSPPGAVVRAEALGSLRFLLAAPDTEEMAAVVLARLAPLAEHDAVRDSQLLLTLETFLREGGNRPRTAARCHIHISTLKYRLAQIARLLDCSLADARVRFELMLAFELERLLRFTGRDVLRTAA